MGVGTAKQDGPLAGVRVADFTWVRAGPQATRILGLLGAEVIRVEWPEHHDIIRLGSPWTVPEGVQPGFNSSADFNNFNCNKLGITLNTRAPLGLELAKRFISICDVVIENFRAGAMKRMGLGYEALRRVNPSLVYVSLAGFGQTGPLRDYAAYGPTMQALSGLTFMSGLPGKPPAGWGYAYMDHIAGFYGAAGVLAALHHRNTTGQGQYVDVAQVEVGAMLMGPAILDATVHGRSTAREGFPPGNRAHWPGSSMASAYRGPQAAPHNAYRCKGSGKNDWCVIACYAEDEWQGLVTAIGSPSWAADKRFGTMLSRLKHQEALDALIERWTSSLDKYEVMERLQRAGIACATVQGASDKVKHDPQLRHRGTYASRAMHPVLGERAFEGMPLRFRHAPWSLRKASPTIGEDNRYVYSEVLGLSWDEMANAKSRGSFWPPNMARQEAPA